MKIYVLSPALETLGVISNYKSLKHKKEFAGNGSFTLKAPFTQALFGLLAEDNILYWSDNGRPAAVYINSVICDDTEKDSVITAAGENLRELLHRRIVWENIDFSGTVELLARTIIDDNCINPSDTDRTIPLLELETLRGLTPEITRQTDNEHVDELLDNVTASSDVGFDITLDTDAKRFVFICYEGADRRTTQSVNPWVIVSRDRNNVVTQTYTRSNEAYRNTALIAGKIDETTGERTEETIAAGSGLTRREIFVNASSVRYKVGDGETEAEALARYSASLLQKGAEKLARQVDVNTLECELAETTLDKIDIGDKVTAIDKRYNIITQTFISEITAYYEAGERSYDVVVGESVPTIYKKLEKGMS